MSHPASRSRTNSDANHFGPATEEEMEADLMRVDAMEDKEVTSLLRAGFTMGELQAQLLQIRLSLLMLDFLLVKI